jgi:membrane-associated phospholipid phosphatase
LGVAPVIKVEIIAEPYSRSAVQWPMLRTSEWVLVSFFAYIAVIAPWFPRRPLLKSQPSLLFIVLTALFILLARAERIRRLRGVISFARDILPIAATLLAFKELGLFQPLHFHHHYENIWIHWDDVVLRQWRVRRAIESAGPAIPMFLEVCYFLVYGVGLFGVAVLYAARRRVQVDTLLSLYVFGTLLAYSFFPYFPSEPPRIAFPHVDEPHAVTAIRQLNLWILEKGTIHSGVFPSAHVSSAFSAAWAMFFVLPRRKILAWGMVFYAGSVSVATVYGRYHYVADVIAGFGVSCVAAAIFWYCSRSSGRGSRKEPT